MGCCSFYDSRYCGICDSSYCIFQKEQGRVGGEKQLETIPPDYKRGLCDNGDMRCGHGYVTDDVGNTINKRLIVLVTVRRFLLQYI